MSEPTIKKVSATIAAKDAVLSGLCTFPGFAELIADFKQHEFPAASASAERRAATETPSAIGRPSPYTREMDAARIAAMDDVCGVNDD